jgi:hypothetical protein
MRLKCKLCGVEFDQLPPQAVQVGNPKGSFRLYLIDGQMHDIGSTQLGRKKSAVTQEIKA